MTYWLTSDHHFGHANVIKYCSRPFSSVDEMDAELIRRWNERVHDSDEVYHLGDFTLGDRDMFWHYFNQLKGHIKILANPWHHDKRWLGNQWPDHPRLWLCDPMDVWELPEYGNGTRPQVLVLCHYAMAIWDRKHYGAWHVYGHSHGQYKPPPGDLALDVGVDCHDFYPISLNEVAEKMRALGWKPPTA